MNDILADYYRCPQDFGSFEIKRTTASVDGYFKFGPDVICFGKHPKSTLPGASDNPLYDAGTDTRIDNRVTSLSFDPQETIDNLRYERYADGSGNEREILRSTIVRAYYLVRPFLPLALRKRLLKTYLRRRSHGLLPKWPVDTTVDDLAETLLRTRIQAQGGGRIPFIWFWPDGASSGAIMTHDVETQVGRDYCDTMMDIDDSFGMPASFQLIPEKRYSVSLGLLSRIRERGFEINVHDLNHDGLLFRNKQEFLRRAEKINSYAEQFKALGFRSAILFHKQEWYDALNFEYDMSVASAGRLDPLRGGCCTVMPYFIRDLLELPVTTTQDYSLFYILNDYSLDLWKEQIALIMQKHGLISFIVHPDYVLRGRELQIFKKLLEYLAQLRAEQNVWIATPGEVNLWWRQRTKMSLIPTANGWRIEGPGSERACIAYASEENGRLKLSVEPGNLRPVQMTASASDRINGGAATEAECRVDNLEPATTKGRESI